MKWAEISISTTHEATEAVANIFHDLGASGVVIEDPELVNAYRRSGSWDYCDIPEEIDTETVVVKAYLPVDSELDEKLNAFKGKVDELCLHELDKGSGAIQCKEIQEDDWASCWKDHFHPIRVGERVVIKPTWESYEVLPDDVIVEIDPGMAFGTGTHHTTSMCIRSLEEIIKPGAVVFDVGAGSGILSITAAKLGASSVRAIDFDAVAVRVAAENVAQNGVEDIVSTAYGDLLKGIDGKADVIIANIIADIIIKLLPDIPKHLNDDGIFLASGIILERLGDVAAAVLQNGLVVDKVTEEGGWAAMVIRIGGA